jgi:hypothetical protein
VDDDAVSLTADFELFDRPVGRDLGRRVGEQIVVGEPELGLVVAQGLPVDDLPAARREDF